MTRLKEIMIRVVIPVLLLSFSLACVGVMTLLAPTAENEMPDEVVFPVEVMEAKVVDTIVMLDRTGTVEAEQRVTLSPEVSGRVVRVARDLRPGRMLDRGEMIVEVDSRDYRTALSVEEARLRQAELELALEEKRQRTSQREWELVGSKSEEEPLALRKPHLALAKANLEASRQAVERAQRNVLRTALRAPFNAVVVSENVDVGQLVGAASGVVTLVGTDGVRVTVSVPVERLGQLDIPGVNAEQGSRVRVRQALTGQRFIERMGTVSGLVGQLNAGTRTASVLVTVPDPFVEGESPLLPGAFVQVQVIGREFSGVIEVPLSALYEQSHVWVDDKGRLGRREVEVGWSTSESAFVVGGLSGGDKVILTPLSLPVVGMKLDSSVVGLPVAEEQSDGS